MHRVVETLRADKGLLVLIALFFIITPVLLTPWIHGHDGLGYYMIMRSFFIDGDLDFSNEIEQYQQKFPDLTFPISEITNKPYTHYGIGPALLWTPFFTVAHIFVKVNNFFGGSIPDDGFSYPYLLLVCFGSAFYAFVGIILIYVMAQEFVSRQAALVASILLLFGSPLMYYMYFSSTVSHAHSFFVVTLFLFYWHKTRGNRTYANWITLGLLSALVFLVRQEDSLVFLFPAIESLVQYAQSLKHKFDVHLVFKNALYLVVFIAAIIPQFLFFRVLYGMWFVTGKQLERHAFDLSYVSHVYKILISQDHGLFVWIPLGLIGIIGWYFLYKKDRLFTVNAAAAILAFILFTATVKQWMAIGSFSARHFIGVLGLFALGAGCLYDKLSKKIPYPYLLCASALLCLWNLNIILQYGAGMLGIQDPLYLSNVLENTLYKLPKQVLTILSKFLLSRGEFIS